MKNFIHDSNRYKTVFIIHPIDPNNVDAIIGVENKLRELGYIPIQPLELFEHLDIEPDAQVFLEGSMSAMALCPIVVMLDNWENDDNAYAMVQTARLMKKQVIPVTRLEIDLKPINGTTSEFKGY